MPLDAAALADALKKLTGEDDMPGLNSRALPLYNMKTRADILESMPVFDRWGLHPTGFVGTVRTLCAPPQPQAPRRRRRRARRKRRRRMKKRRRMVTTRQWRRTPSPSARRPPRRVGSRAYSRFPRTRRLKTPPRAPLAILPRSLNTRPKLPTSLTKG
jgi:hypothetical protein